MTGEVCVKFLDIRKEGQDKLENAARIPTLIGMDFLELHRFDLFISLDKNRAYLERIEEKGEPTA